MEVPDILLPDICDQPISRPPIARKVAILSLRYPISQLVAWQGYPLEKGTGALLRSLVPT